MESLTELRTGQPGLPCHRRRRRLQPEPAVQAGAGAAQPGRHEPRRGDRRKDGQAGAAEDAEHVLPEQEHQGAGEAARHGRLHLPPGNNQRTTESYGFD